MDVSAPLRRAERRMQRRLLRRFERRMHISTAETAGIGRLGREVAGRAFYVASPPVTTRRALERLAPGPRDVFVDIGSGKGQVVLIAAQLPFGRAIGVDISDDLCEVARRNVETSRDKLRCGDVEIVTADALEWPIPDDLSVAFMYCPFVGDLFDAFVARLLASYDRCPRRLHVVYSYPWEHNRLLATGRFAVVDVAFANWPTRPRWWDSDHVIVTYCVLPPGGDPAVEPLRQTGLAHAKALRYWSSPNDTHFEIHPPDGPALYSHPPR